MYVLEYFLSGQLKSIVHTKKKEKTFLNYSSKLEQKVTNKMLQNVSDQFKLDSWYTIVIPVLIFN